jgi:plasmid maintenance system antidote protein VapI
MGALLVIWRLSVRFSARPTFFLHLQQEVDVYACNEAIRDDDRHRVDFQTVSGK